MNYTQMVSNIINNKYKNNDLILARELQNQIDFAIPETALFKALERLEDSGQIARLSKGIYYIPQNSKYGAIKIGQNEIINYFLGKKGKNGLLTGYALFNKYNITTQISKSVIVYSNLIREEFKKIGDVQIKKINMNLSNDLINHIEFLEILQNYTLIEDLNNKMFCHYIKTITQYYNNDIMEKVLRSKKYKKSTIAFAEQLLNNYDIQNTLSKHLTKTSIYKIPKVGENYAAPLQ